jgi:hypothetical protein
MHAYPPGYQALALMASMSSASDLRIEISIYTIYNLCVTLPHTVMGWQRLQDVAQLANATQAIVNRCFASLQRFQ